MGLNKLKYRSNAFLAALLLAGILAVLNAFSYRHFSRIDLTQNKVYTISSSTRKIVSGLDDLVNIKVYLSKKIPPYMIPITEQVKDLLTEIRICARGNVDIEYIDPADDPSMPQRLRFMGIPQLRLNIIEKDQAAVTDVYMGLAILYKDNREIIPALTDVATLEYELAGKLLRATSAETSTIGFFSGRGGPGIRQELATMNKLLREQYFTRSVQTVGGAKIPDGVDVLVVPGPRILSDRDLFEIDQFIMSGGKAVFLVDAVDIDGRSLRGQVLNSTIGKLLEHYGVKVLPELVLDQMNASASFQSGPYNIHVPYPFWVRILGDSVQTGHPIINSLESMVLPWASPLEIMKEEAGDRDVTVLAKSTDYSWTQKGPFDLDPQIESMPGKDQLRQRIMAVALTGTFESFFADKTVPEPLARDREGTDNATGPPAAETRSIIKQSPETKIIVVGNSRFISGDFPVEFEGNRTFFQNAVDWLILGDALIDVRSRESGERPLMIVPDRVKTLVRFVNMFAISLLLAAFGLVQFWIRNRRKRLAAGGGI